MTDERATTVQQNSSKLARTWRRPDEYLREMDLSEKSIEIVRRIARVRAETHAGRDTREVDLDAERLLVHVYMDAVRAGVREKRRNEQAKSYVNSALLERLSALTLLRGAYPELYDRAVDRDLRRELEGRIEVQRALSEQAFSGIDTSSQGELLRALYDDARKSGETTWGDIADLLNEAGQLTGKDKRDGRWCGRIATNKR